MPTFPVLPLTDAVLLPGMVVPVTLDQTTQAVIDAARATGDQQLLAVPRVDGEYGSTGTIAVIEKVGRQGQGAGPRSPAYLTSARSPAGSSGPCAKPAR